MEAPVTTTRESRLALQAVSKRRQQVRTCMTAVEVACSRPLETPSWGDNLQLALRELRQVFADHAQDGRAPRSALRQIGERRPDLARSVRGVQEEQISIIDRIVELERRSATQPDDTLRDDVGSLLMQLSRYRQTCSDLFFECYCVDVTPSTG